MGKDERLWTLVCRGQQGVHTSPTETRASGYVA